MQDLITFAVFLIMIIYPLLFFFIAYLAILAFIALHRANRLMKYKLREYEAALREEPVAAPKKRSGEGRVLWNRQHITG